MNSTNMDSVIVSQIDFSENISNNFYTCNFYLKDEQFKNFRNFYENRNDDHAYSTHEDHSNSKSDEDEVHGVVLISENLLSTLLNSW